MNAYALLEVAVIGTLAGWSAWVLLGRVLPTVRARLLRALGRASNAPAGCASGCSACSGCGAASAPPARRSGDTPVRFDALR